MTEPRGELEPGALVKPDTDFTQSFDGKVWAEAFVRHVKANPGIATDEGTMLAWFCNALMRGWDEHARRYPVASLHEQIDTTSPKTCPPEPHCAHCGWFISSGLCRCTPISGGERVD